jgi:hypothetical protein
MFSTWELILYIFLPGYLLVGGAVWFIRRRNRSQELRAPSPPAVNRTYLGLRNQLLQGLSGKVTLPEPRSATQPYAVLMDWHVTRGTATVVAVADGTASIYLSGGGGSLGGGQSQPVIHAAALRAVSVASEFQPQMQVTTDYPLPEPGSVIFYVVTNAGVFTAAATVTELSAHRHPLSKLGDCMQEIVTQYRLLAAR